MNVGVSTADEAEITLLIKNHFEGMRWTRVRLGSPETCFET